ncbi:MAG: serine/threonine protein kinase [Alphaproteobacteria bacterium]|nr:serine/threonine protein kinase [Alphaproteobacteria bacterium]
MTYDNAQNSGSSSGVMLGAKIEIFPTSPLPELNTAGGMAFGARYRTETASDLYAIVCMSSLPPRIESVTSMRTIDNPSIVKLVESGVVTWPDGQRAYAFVYQRPLAPRMMADLNETHAVLNEDSIRHHFIAPMVNALVSLMVSGLVHNAIRPTNIFWRIGNAAPPQIGECLSVPAGIGQPVIFEPIERAQAMPLGRGPGIHADDCYAFGATLASLIVGHNPLNGLDDAAIIDMKMQRGSFGTLVGSQRLPPAHIEILRGLLTDDSQQRWSAADLDQWLNGRRMTLKSSDAGKRSTRHFDFLGKEYWQASLLATALAANVSEAAKVIENESMNKWLRRAMNDEDRARAVEGVVHDLKTSGKTAHYEEQLVARVSIALDPAAPIRYRGIATMPSGIASLLADAVVTGNNAAALSEVISSQLVGVWIEQQHEHKGDFVSILQLFERMKGLIDKLSYGNGIERVTYELNQGLPCLSPMLRGQYVTAPKMLLPALERVAASGTRPREPMDRHIAAFLIVRDKRSESLFDAMALPEGSMKRGLALLNLFAELQYRNGPEELPQLAAWLAPFVEPAVRRFLSKALRERMQKLIAETAKKGDLNGLVRLIDDHRRIERDRQEFTAARILYLNIQKEIAGLEAKLNNRESVVRSSGKPMAASISSFLAIALICVAIIMAMFNALFMQN